MTLYLIKVTTGETQQGVPMTQMHKGLRASDVFYGTELMVISLTCRHQLWISKNSLWLSSVSVWGSKRSVPQMVLGLEFVFAHAVQSDCTGRQVRPNHSRNLQHLVAYTLKKVYFSCNICDMRFPSVKLEEHLSFLLQSCFFNPTDAFFFYINLWISRCFFLFVKVILHNLLCNSLHEREKEFS